MISYILALGVSHILQLLLKSQLLSLLTDNSLMMSCCTHREEIFIAAAHSTAALHTTEGLQGTRLSDQHIEQIPNSTQDLFFTQSRKQNTLCTTFIHRKHQDRYEDVILETSLETHIPCVEVTPRKPPFTHYSLWWHPNTSVFLYSFVAAILAADPKETFSNFWKSG